jgi:hypothetical protein
MALTTFSPQGAAVQHVGARAVRGATWRRKDSSAMKRKKETEAEAIQAVKDAMAHLTFEGAVAAQMTAAQFEVLEARLTGLRFPAGYRWFLLHQNGGRPKPKAFAWREGDEEVESAAEQLLGFDARPMHDAERAIDITLAALQYRSDLPAMTVPIGLVDRDDILLLYYHGPNEGQVWLKLWEQVTFVTDEPNNPDAGTYLIAESFAEFLKMLRDGSE